MNRVEAAIHAGRCVIAVGGRALRADDVLAELNRRSALPIVALGGEVVAPAILLDAVSVAPALDNPGGVVVLIEPDPAADGKALNNLDKLIRGSKNKPRLVVAARAFNPFGLPMGLRLLKTEQEKKRASDFLGLLPVPAAAPVAAAPEAKAPRKKKARPGDNIRAPRAVLIGREEELPQLVAMLSEDGGPIVVTGPSGVGRRWMVEAALKESGLARLPDLTLARGNGVDSLLSRLAISGKQAGDDRLHDALTARGERPTPTAMAALVAEVLAGEAFAGKAMVVLGLDRLLDPRDSSFRNDGRLEILLRTILISTPALRLVFVSEVAPAFYREGQATNLRTYAVGGIRGRDLHALFEQYESPEFARDRFGPISERTHGHPIASRAFAISSREEGDVEEFVEQKRFMAAHDLTDLKSIRRHYRKRIADLNDTQRALLGALATPLDSVDSEALRVLGVNRATRLRLLADGLLEQTPIDEGRRFYVHPLVAEHLTGREVQDFAIMETLGNYWLSRSRDLKNKGELVESIALAQAGNRLLIGARRARSCIRLPYPDGDAAVDDIRGLVRRRKNPRLDIARQRVNELLGADPGNTELLLVDAELKVVEKASPEAIQKTFEHAATIAPTPEVFHAAANWCGHKARGKAVGWLERGVEAFPEDARLRRRLAGLYLDQNRLEDAAETLRAARDLEPMMPDTYAMLGEIYTLQGPAQWDDADECISEALRLSPDHPQHLARKAFLLRKRSFVLESAEAAPLLEEAEALAAKAYQAEKGDPRLQVLFATLIVDRGGDLEQARWLLQQAVKRRETPGVWVQRARVLTRQGHVDEAENVIDRAIKKAGGLFEAFEVKGEIELARGNVFGAVQALQTARERSPKDAPERVRYERRLAEYGALIESGAANEMLKASEGHEKRMETASDIDGPRRDAGTTTKLRKGAAEEGAAEEGAAEKGIAEKISELTHDVGDALVGDAMVDAVEDVLEVVGKIAEDVAAAVSDAIDAPSTGAPDATAGATAEDAGEAPPAEASAEPDAPVKTEDAVAADAIADTPAEAGEE